MQFFRSDELKQELNDVDNLDEERDWTSYSTHS
jgi:hypothetical protein